MFAVVIMAVSLVSAQKAEHYNSPLYSPRTYDPNVTSANGLPDTLKKVGIEQKLGDQLPLDTELKDEDGNIVTLGSYFGKGRPVIVAFVYYECPMLCNQVLNGLTGSLKGVSFDAGKEFGLEDPSDSQVQRSFRGVGLGGGDGFLELIDQRLPIANVFEVRQTRLLIHAIASVGSTGEVQAPRAMPTSVHCVHFHCVKSGTEVTSRALRTAVVPTRIGCAGNDENAQ